MNAVAPTLAARALSPLRVTGLLLLASFVGLATLWAAARFSGAPPLLAATGATKLLPIALSALTLALAGLAGGSIMTSARLRASEMPAQGTASPRRWRIRLPHRRRGDPASIGKAARWPQATLVGGLALAAIALAALPAASVAIEPAAHFILGASAILLTFPLLVAERWFAAVPTVRLPEAPAIRRLLLLPVLAWPAAGLLELAAGLGFRPAAPLQGALAVVLGLAAAELFCRAAARCFLPPPTPEAARAAIDTILPRLLADGLRSGGLSTPIRAHLGIDFSRSWALRFLRHAALPVVLALACVTWGLTGLVLVGTDGRAVYERFGAPVAVLGPGLHAILPWPMGHARRLEYGVMHEISPEAVDLAAFAPPPAEGPAPLDADRLWEQAHPAEQLLLIAAQSSGKDSFQVVSADIRLRYRIGMSDADAIRAAYAAADPEALMRAVAGQVIARFCAGETLDALLGENREQLGERLRRAVQARMDADRTGLEISAVIIEAIHPPSGAAEAYHAVQAAEIMANTAVAAERGRASATLSHAAQYAAELVAQAQAGGAEATSRATADTASFVADEQSATAHRDSFLLERRLAALSTGLGKSTLTIIDRRIPATTPPTLDLRPLTPLTANTLPRDGE